MQQMIDTRLAFRTPGSSGHASVLFGNELTPREQVVLRLMSAGMGDAEIAERLALNCLTVRVFGSNALMKLGSASVQAAGVEMEQVAPR